jgi:hypothetical protein
VWRTLRTCFYRLAGVPVGNDTSRTGRSRGVLDRPRSPERQIFDSSRPLVLRCCPGDQFKVFHHLADRNTQLMRVDDAGEILALAQPSCSLAEEVLVLRDEDATEVRRFSNTSSANSAEPSSCAVRTSIERKRKARVTARRTCTSMYSDMLKEIASDQATCGGIPRRKDARQACRILPIRA